MYNDGAFPPEFFVDHGLYYPTATSCGYVATGFEPTSDWEEYRGVFGLDGQDMQYIGAGNESVPYLYYAPGYGYGQSPYNPYNPYIPGAVVGADGSYIAPQHYYALSSYENSVALPAYPPMVLQYTPNTVTDDVEDSFTDKELSVSQVNDVKQNFSSNIRNSSHAVVGDTSSQRTSFARVPEGSRASTVSVKLPVPSLTYGIFPSQAATRARGAQGMDNGSSAKVSSGGTQLKTTFPSTNGSSGFTLTDHIRSSASKVNPKLLYGRVLDDGEGNSDILSEQNQGSRKNKSKNQLVVKARTTMAGNPDAQGNIIIFVDQYNRVDFPIDYKYAKFFVIKSYSEDDVHKSIKYNVWSSTPNGNKKLNAVYEGAQRMAAGDPRGCPIFFFFSVNASGQFCGVAEMTGPVDFDKNMDFWQQHKWSGCFPVKWHFVKDLPNPNFRHIILENNENKPVTNSRDTTEIPYKKGLEMLRIFKNYTSKTSLLDDFMYYENRQRIMQEERVRLLMKSYKNPYLVPLLDPPRKLQPIHDFPSVGDVHVTKHDEDHSGSQNKNNVDANSSVTNPSVHLGQGSSDSNNSDSTVSTGSDQGLADAVPNMVDELKISSLSINSQEPVSESSVTIASSILNSESGGVVTIGSMPVKVKDTKFSTFLTVGTIPLDPRALQLD